MRAWSTDRPLGGGSPSGRRHEGRVPAAFRSQLSPRRGNRTNRSCATGHNSGRQHRGDARPPAAEQGVCARAHRRAAAPPRRPRSLSVAPQRGPLSTLHTSRRPPCDLPLTAGRRGRDCAGPRGPNHPHDARRESRAACPPARPPPENADPPKTQRTPSPLAPHPPPLPLHTNTHRRPRRASTRRCCRGLLRWRAPWCASSTRATTSSSSASGGRATRSWSHRVSADHDHNQRWAVCPPRLVLLRVAPPLWGVAGNRQRRRGAREARCRVVSPPPPLPLPAARPALPRPPPLQRTASLSSSSRIPR